MEHILKALILITEQYYLSNIFLLLIYIKIWISEEETDDFAVMVHPGMRHPQGGPQRPPMARNPSGGMDPYSQDPYAKPPSTPQTPQKSPSKIQWPGQAQESDPYENPPATPAEGMSSGHPGHPYDRSVGFCICADLPRQNHIQTLRMIGLWLPNLGMTII